ncbi:MAG: tetratricopeptide repeat protein [Deltaproteobacteria bacterium]|nr:tetratricopeptide repeat protein [Deltaproteobacteria bacterium]
MSLIIDALKKAQQLRSIESKGSPFFRGRSPDRKGPKQWAWFILLSSLILLIIIVGVWKILLPPSPPEPVIKIAERKPSPAVIEKIPPELPKEEEKKNLEMIEEPKITPPPVSSPAPKEVKSVRKKLTIPKKENIESLPQTKPEEKIAGTPKKEEKADAEVKSSQEKPTVPPPPKEEVIPKPVVLEQGTGRDRHLTMEVIQHFNMGVAYYHQGDVLKAIQAYQKVIQLEPNHMEAHNNLGIIYQEIGKPENALQAYQKAIEINPRYEKALNNMGIIFYLRGEDEKAMEAFKKVLSINPNHIGSHIHLGTLYKKKGQMEKGIESYQKALSIDPLHGETHYNLGLLYEQIGNRELAIQHYRQFVQSSSNAYPELASKVRRHIQQMLKTKEGKKE